MVISCQVTFVATRDLETLQNDCDKLRAETAEARSANRLQLEEQRELCKDRTWPCLYGSFVQSAERIHSGQLTHPDVVKEAQGSVRQPASACPGFGTQCRGIMILNWNRWRLQNCKVDHLEINEAIASSRLMMLLILLVADS